MSKCNSNSWAFVDKLVCEVFRYLQPLHIHNEDISIGGRGGLYTEAIFIGQNSPFVLWNSTKDDMLNSSAFSLVYKIPSTRPAHGVKGWFWILFLLIVHECGNFQQESWIVWSRPFYMALHLNMVPVYCAYSFIPLAVVWEIAIH
jgi:hypothetical protein